MFSLTVKKNIARVFLFLVIAPAIFLTPFFSKKINIAHAEEATQAGTENTAAPTSGGTGGDPNAASPVIAAANTNTNIPDTWSCLNNLGICIIIYSSWALFIKLPGWIAEMASLVSNTLFAYGLSSSTYKDMVGSPFINTGWVVCRDIANTFFIFALLYIAIMTILGKLSGGTKKLLMTVIIVALFMNFSMYITRFVIDVGNMSALEFYNTFDDMTGWSALKSFPGITEKDITGGFLKPLMISADNVLNSMTSGITANWPMYVFTWFCLGCVVIVFTFCMLAASFLMVGRVAMLWILMIISPLAFFSLCIPYFSSKWSSWTGALVSQTFFPVTYLFFLYLATQLTNATATLFTASTTDPFQMLFTLLLRAATIAAFLIYGLKMASGMAGTAGSMASKYLTIGTGAALGVGAWALRAGAGRTGDYYKDKWARKGETDDMQSSIAGRMQLAIANKAQTSTFDIRNTGAFQSAGSMAGLSQFGRTTGLTYAQKQAQGEQEKLNTFKSLKTDEQKIAYLRSIEGFNVLGKGPMNIVDTDASARKLMSSLSVKERQDLVEKSAKMSAGDQRFMKRVNADLGEANYTSEGLLERYKSMEGDPKKQAEFIAGLRGTSIDANKNPVRGRTPEEMKTILKGVTETNRAEIEANLTNPEDKEFITSINKQIVEGFKPRLQEAAKIERRNFEKQEEFRGVKNSLKEKIAQYNETLNEAEKQSLQKEAAELVKRMGDNGVASLDERDIENELVSKNLTRTQLEKINRSNTLNVDWDKIKIGVKNGNDQKAKEYLDLSPISNINRQVSGEGRVWTPSGRGVNEGDLRR